MSNPIDTNRPQNSAEAMFWPGAAPPAPSSTTSPASGPGPARAASTPTRIEFSPYAPEPPRTSAGPLIVVGLVAIAIGLFITFASYVSAADRGGGTYMVLYGPIVFGVITLFRGLARLGDG